MRSLFNPRHIDVRRLSSTYRRPAAANHLDAGHQPAGELPAPQPRALPPLTERLRDAAGVFVVGAALAMLLNVAYQALRTVIAPALPRPRSGPSLTLLRRPAPPPPAAPVLPAEPADLRPVHTGAFAAFHYRSYAVFFIGVVFGVNGYWIYFTAQGWLALQLTDSAAGISLLFTVSSFPMIVLTLYGGALADRVNRRWLIVCTRMAVFAILGAMGLAAIAGAMTVPVFVGLSLLLGIAWAIDLPARQAMVTDVVPVPAMANAFSWQSAMMFVGSTVGPIAAGSVVANFGPGPALLLAAILHGLVAVNVVFLESHQVRAHSVESVMSRIMGGLRFIRSREQVLLLVVLACVPTVTVWGMQPLLPLVARDVLHGNAATYGYLTGAIGVGSIVGAVFVAVAHRVRVKGWLAALGTLIAGLAVVAFAYSTSLPPALAFLLVHGAALGVAQTITAAMAQILTPPDYQGRVAGVYVMTYNLTPVGIIVFGAVAQAQGVPFGIWASGLAMVAITLLLTLARPALRQIRQ